MDRFSHQLNMRLRVLHLRLGVRNSEIGVTLTLEPSSCMKIKDETKKDFQMRALHIFSFFLFIRQEEKIKN